MSAKYLVSTTLGHLNAHRVRHGIPYICTYGTHGFRARAHMRVYVNAVQADSVHVCTYGVHILFIKRVYCMFNVFVVHRFYSKSDCLSNNE